MYKMKKIKHLNKKNILTFIIIISIVISISIIAFSRQTISVELDNHSELEPNSEITYYLDIRADGIDKYSHSTDYHENSVAETKSGYLFIEDVVPNGLTFNGFVTTEDGTIGAHSEYGTCDGYVIDDSEGLEDINNYHGLHYNEETKTVSFKVKNLQAGCTLTVGIKAMVPSYENILLTQPKRYDFYNTSIINGDGFPRVSNTVHSYAGENGNRFWNVTYEIDGDIDWLLDNYKHSYSYYGIDMPDAMLYSEGSIIQTLPEMYIEGYDFSGWHSEDVTIDNNQFTMPNKNIVIKGTFTKAKPYKVTYEIEGELPDEYIVPDEKEYYPNQTIKIDFLEKGNTFNDATFNGWQTEDINVEDDGTFLMPNHDIKFTGSFNIIKYKVEYQFDGDVVPPNSADLLPTTKWYKPGEKIVLENVISPSGFKFVGWNKDKKFIMPEEDVYVTGEWVVRYGDFSPTITNEILNKKEKYEAGDTIQYKITITNTATFRIREIIVKEHNEDSYFIEGVEYEKNTDHFVTIPTIEPGEKVEVYAEYVVKEEDQIITNTAEIMGAINDNNYELNTDVAYKATNEITRQASNSTLKICKKVSGVGPERYFQFNIKSTTEEYETSIRIKENECRTITINQGTYIVNEIIPSEYQLESVKGSITSNNSELIVEDGNEYEITFTNKFKRKGFLHSFGTTINEVVQGG